MLFRFNDCSIDADGRELRRGAELIEMGPQVFDLLIFLIRNRDRVVSKDDMLDAIWSGRFVSESTLASRINAACNAIGDNGAEQTLIKTIAREGFRFIGEVRVIAASIPAAHVRSVSAGETAPRQEARFCTAADCVRIAYTAVGKV